MGKPEQSAVALLFIDVINSFDFQDNEGIVAASRRAAPKILALRERAHAAEIPVIYVNDTFAAGSDFVSTLEACIQTEQPGHHVARLLPPTENDYVLLKPNPSAFDSTELEPLLKSLGARKLVLVGFATDLCVLKSAKDALARGYELWVPSDCTAANTPELAEQALAELRTISTARTDESLEVDMAAWRYSD